MNVSTQRVLSLGLLVLATACHSQHDMAVHADAFSGSSPQGATAGITAPVSVAPVSAASSDLPSARPVSAAGVAGADAVVTILATSDVHGWMAPRIDRQRDTWEGGLETLVDAWQKREGLDLEARSDGERGGYLLVDSGDMWTGPPLSTLTRGRPLVDIYNAVTYDAVAIGNHEFDFGVDNLREQAGRARFPFLAANLTSPDGSVDLSFRRGHVLVDVSGVRVGIIGLAFRDTPRVTFPPNVVGLAFGDYEPALRVEARQLLENEGAQVLVVLVHDGIDALRALAQSTADLPIRAFFGGHTHRAALEVVDRDPATVGDDVVLAVPRSKARYYTRVALSFRSGQLVGHTETQVILTGNLSDGPHPSSPLVTAVEARVKKELGPELDEVVGVARTPIEVGDRSFSPLGVLVTESWLAEIPKACLAITNIGGLRQPIDAGEVTTGDILGVLPFANHLGVVRLTGAQVKFVLENPLLVLGGGRLEARLTGDRRVVDAIYLPDGRQLADTTLCSVVTTDYLYAGGDGAAFAQFDPDPQWLKIGWREPVLAFFRARGLEGVSAPKAPPPSTIPAPSGG